MFKSICYSIIILIFVILGVILEDANYFIAAGTFEIVNVLDSYFSKK